MRGRSRIGVGHETRRYRGKRPPMHWSAVVTSAASRRVLHGRLRSNRAKGPLLLLAALGQCGPLLRPE